MNHANLHCTPHVVWFRIEAVSLDQNQRHQTKTAEVWCSQRQQRGREGISDFLWPKRTIITLNLSLLTGNNLSS